MPGSVKKQGKDTWRVRYDLPRDPATGKRRQGSKTVRGTKKDAEKRLREILSEIDGSAYLEPSKMTTGEYMEQWFEAHSASLRPKSQERYMSLMRAHIVPELGRIPLARLAPVHIQMFYAQKVKGGRRDGKEGGLSPAAVRYLHNVLREALEEAVSLNLIAANPAARVNPPRVRQPEMRPLSEGEVKAFLEAARGTRFEALFITALGTGLRRGELLGLRWEDLDLNARTLTVRNAVVNVRGKPTLQPPKTAASKRAVALPASIVAALKKHRVAQIQEKLKAGPLYQDQGLVFCSEVGTPLNPENLVKRHFYPLLEKAGLPRVRFHDLRHTHATLLLAEGVNVKVISERRGHTNAGFTIKTYTHVLPNMQKEAADKFDCLLLSGEKDTEETKRAQNKEG